MLVRAPWDDESEGALFGQTAAPAVMHKTYEPTLTFGVSEGEGESNFYGRWKTGLSV